MCRDSPGTCCLPPCSRKWEKQLIYYRNKAVLGFPGEESLVFIRTVFSYRRETDPEAGGGSRGKFDGERISDDLFGNGAGDESGGIP